MILRRVRGTLHTQMSRQNRVGGSLLLARDSRCDSRLGIAPKIRGAREIHLALFHPIIEHIKEIGSGLTILLSKLWGEIILDSWGEIRLMCVACGADVTFIAKLIAKILLEANAIKVRFWDRRGCHCFRDIRHVARNARIGIKSYG